MRTRSERATRLDDDRRHAVWGWLPRRADPERPDRRAAVEVPPAILPPVGDLDCGDVAERSSGSCLAGGVGVRGELDAGAGAALLEPLREQLEHCRARLFRAISRNDECD